MHSGIARIEVDPRDITKRAAMNDHIVKGFRKSGIPTPPWTLRDTGAGTWMKVVFRRLYKRYREGYPSQVA